MPTTITKNFVGTELLSINNLRHSCVVIASKDVYLHDAYGRYLFLGIAPVSDKTFSIGQYEGLETYIKNVGVNTDFTLSVDFVQETVVLAAEGFPEISANLVEHEGVYTNPEIVKIHNILAADEEKKNIAQFTTKQFVETWKSLKPFSSTDYFSSEMLTGISINGKWAFAIDVHKMAGIVTPTYWVLDEDTHVHFSEIVCLTLASYTKEKEEITIFYEGEDLLIQCKDLYILAKKEQGIDCKQIVRQKTYDYYKNKHITGKLAMSDLAKVCKVALATAPTKKEAVFYIRFEDNKAFCEASIPALEPERLVKMYVKDMQLVVKFGKKHAQAAVESFSEQGLVLFTFSDTELAGAMPLEPPFEGYYPKEEEEEAAN